MSYVNCHMLIRINFYREYIKVKDPKDPVVFRHTGPHRPAGAPAQRAASSVHSHNATQHTHAMDR